MNIRMLMPLLARRNRKKRSIIVGIAVTALLLLAISFTPLSSVVAPSLFFVARPIWITRGHLFSGGELITGFLREKSDLVAENRALKAEKERMERALAGHDFLRQEYRALVSSFGHIPDNPAVVLAAVLMKPPATPYDTLIIDAGKRHGLVLGDEVRVGAVAVGDIIDVEQSTSKVALFSAPGRLSAVVVTDGAIPVSAQGEGGGTFRFSFPRDASLKEGDPIFFPGTPPVLFGTVGSIEARPTGPLKTVLFRSPVNMQELQWVTVIKTNRTSL